MTVQVLQVVQQWREALKDSWANGTFRESAPAQFHAMGAVENCQDILNMDYETFIKELGYDEPDSKQ